MSLRDKQVEKVTQPETAVLNQLISDFTSNLASQNIDAKGKLTFIMGNSAEIDIHFQPPQTPARSSASTLHSFKDLFFPMEHHPVPNVKDTRKGSPVSLTENMAMEHYTDFSSHAPDMFHDSFTSAKLPDPIFAETESTDPRRHSLTPRHSSSRAITLPPFENIMSQKYPLNSSQNPPGSLTNAVNAHGRHFSKGLQGNIAFFKEQGNKDSLQQRSKPTFDIMTMKKEVAEHSPRPNTSSECSTFIASQANTDSITDESVGETDNCKNTYESLDSGDHTDSHLTTVREDDTGAPSVSTDDNFMKLNSLVRDTTGYNGAQTDSSESKISSVFGSLEKSHVDVKSLESLSHSELVAVLLQVLQSPKDIGTTKSAFRSKNLSHSKQDADVKNFNIEESQASSTLTKNNENDKTPEMGKIQEKPQRKGSKFGGTQGPNECQQRREGDLPSHAESHIAVDERKGLKMSLRKKRKSNRSFVTSAEQSKVPHNTETSGQPLKKRNRLRSTLDNDLIIDIRDNHISDSSMQDCERETEDHFDLSKPDKGNAKAKEHTFSCKNCPKVFSNKASYKRHVKAHTSGFQCDVCGKTLKTKDSLYHHQRGLHTKDKPYNCKQCNATFNFHHSYKLHMQRHKGERPHKCNICQKTYLTSNHLKVHIEAAHEVGSIVCHICGKTFSYSCTLKQHLLKHSGERPFHCSRCNKSFITRQSLKVHATSHEESRNYACHICGKMYKSEHSKNAHVKRHGKQPRKFMCELCGQAFHFKSTLNAHINIHSKARPHACKQCGKAFKSKASLYTHKYVHRDSLPFTCTVCGKAFKTKNCCAAHMKRHENQELYPCSQCASIFPDKGGLSKHMKTIHLPRKQFICTICGKKGTRSDNMRIHVKSHRNDNAAVANPMDFIVEEAVSESDIAAGRIPVRSRMRGPRHRNSRRLCTKDLQIHNDQDGASQFREMKQIILGPLSNGTLVKSEMPPVAAVQSTLVSTPVFDHQHYSSHLTFLSGTGTHQDNMTTSLSAIAQEQPQHHHHHSMQHQDQQYHQEHDKYLTYMHQQPELTGVSNNTSLPFGSMASLLSAMTPSSDHDTVNGNTISASVYQNTLGLTSLHAPHHMGPGNQRVVSSMYSEPLPIQGSLSQLQQILTRSNENQSSGTLDHQRSSAVTLEEQGQLFSPAMH